MVSFKLTHLLIACQTNLLFTFSVLLSFNFGPLFCFLKFVSFDVLALEFYVSMNYLFYLYMLIMPTYVS